MIRFISPVAIAVLAVSYALASKQGAPRVASGICSLDTSSSNYTLERIEDRLNPRDTTYFGDGFRTQNGLVDATFVGVSIVTDSATCAAGIQAYARITYPNDTIKRKRFLAGLDDIFIVRLTANRFVLNANIYSPQILIEHFLVDSTFAIVNVNF